MSTSPRGLAGVLLALLATSSLTLVVAQDNGDGDRRTITITVGKPAAPPATAVDGPDKDTKRDDALPLDQQAQTELEHGATATDRPGDTHRELAGPLREPSDRQPAGVLDGPLAAQEFPGCRTRFVRNYSSRNGTAVRVIVWHQTVSRDRPGWSDQDGLTALANNPQSGVSWHLLIGRADGNCTFSVPLNMKAWTQANANPFSIGIEVQAYGDEPTYLEPAGEHRLLAVTRELGRRYGIPMRRGLVQNCQVTRSGIVEHSELGRCGGGHADVTPWATDQLIARLAAPTSVDKITCRKLNWWRTHGRPHGLPEQHAVRRRKALESRSVRCTPTGPVKAT